MPSIIGSFAGAELPTYFAQSNEEDFPFKIILQTLDDGTPQIGVVSNSHLFNSEDKDTYEEDNSDWGLLGDDPEQNDPGWMNISAADQGKKIWLEIELDQNDQSIISIEVRYDIVGEDNAWTNFPDPIEINTDDDPSSPYQQFYHQIIGEATDFEEDPRPARATFTFGEGDSAFILQFTQLLKTNLMVTTAHTTADADEPDLPIVVIVPWNGPATSLDGVADEIPGESDLMTPFALGAGVDKFQTPFQVLQVNDPNNPDNHSLIGVTDNSHLFNSEDKDTYEEDNEDWGLLDSDTNDISNAFDVGNIGDKIWLQIQLNKDDQSIEFIDIRHGPVGTEGAWDLYPDPIEINTEGSPYQQFYHQIIAEITDFEQDPRPGLAVNRGTPDSPDKIQVTQLLTTNIMMTTAQTTADADEPNIPLLIAIPWNGPGTAQDGSADEINSDDPDVMTPWQFGGGRQEFHFPFEITFTSDDTGEYANVRPGTIAGVLPDNIFDDFFASSGGTYYIKLTCFTNGYIPTSGSLSIEGDPTDNSDATTQGTPPPDFEVLIGIIVDGEVFQVVYTNLQATPMIAFVESQIPSDPGQEPFVRWWRWGITNAGAQFPI